MLSEQGQQAVIKDGYFPITAKIAEKDARTLGLDGLTHLIFGRVAPGAT